MKKLNRNVPSVYFCLLVVSAVILYLFPVAWQQDLYASIGEWRDGQYLLALVHLITYQFCHANTSHLVGNFFFFFAPAAYLEKRLGAFKFLVFYLLVGIASAAMFMLATAVSPFGLVAAALGMPVYLLGASGSIFGCFTYALMLYGRESWWKAVIVGGAFLAFVVPQFLAAISSVVEPGAVAYFGHLGGCVGALFLGYFITPSDRR